MNNKKLISKVRAWLREQDPEILVGASDVVAGTGLTPMQVNHAIHRLVINNEISKAGTKPRPGMPIMSALYRIECIMDDTEPAPCAPVKMLASDLHEMKMMKIMNGIDEALNFMTRRRLQGVTHGA